MATSAEKSSEVPGVDVSALAKLSGRLAAETRVRFMNDDDPYRTPGGGHDRLSDATVLDPRADIRIEEAIRQYRSSNDTKKD